MELERCGKCQHARSRHEDCNCKNNKLFLCMVDFCRCLNFELLKGDSPVDTIKNEEDKNARKVGATFPERSVLTNFTERQPNTFQEAVDKVLLEMKNLLISKQRDYGARNILEFGAIGVVLRANDKLSRLKHLHGVDDYTFQIKTAKHESIKDSWRDLANYALIALLLESDTFTLPMEPEKKETPDA